MPIFNESKIFPELKWALQWLKANINCLAIEFVLVDDGSSDQTLKFLLEFAENEPSAKILELSRNFGHQAALTAGLDHASGDAVVIMDGDLQDPVELIPSMIEKYMQGFDVVYAQRVSRKGESLFKRATASLFYSLMKYFVFSELPQNVWEFRLMSRAATNAFLKLREKDRFVRGLVTWIGFSQVGIPFERPPRRAGTTKYSIIKMIKFAWVGIISFSGVPPRVGLILGVPLMGVSVVCGAALMLNRFWFGVPFSVGAIVIGCVGFVGAANLICMGILGDYIGRIYEEMKDRPLYLVKNRTNFETSSGLQIENNPKKTAKM